MGAGTGRLSLLVAVSSLLLALSPTSVRAADEGPVESVTIHSLAQHDANGDGRVDQTVIDCAFATARDRITVFDGGGDMASSSNWRSATDFRDDTWLYDIGADGSVQLIVRYAVEGGRSTAYLYDDRDGDAQVAHRISEGAVEVTESPHWTARMRSGADWIRGDGRLNLDVQVELDGPIPTIDRAPDYYVRDYMDQDGQPDVLFEQFADARGVARYAVRRLLAPSPADWGFERSALWVNEGRFVTVPNPRALFPFLPVPPDPADPANRELRYFDLPPNVGVDWVRGAIVRVGLDGYPIGHGYHFNNNAYITPHEINEPAFESPQAYYDLAGDGDGFADLHVRFFTRPPDDASMFTLPTAESIPWQTVSYDWNLFNPGSLRWDFKVGLAGNHDIDSIETFDAFQVRMVPFEDLPYWLTERPWKLTTFLAREGEGYESSEGLYEWMADNGDDPERNPERAFRARDATFGYMLGATTTPPAEYFTSTHVGFRAERRLETPGPPMLYFSSIDRKLHLLGAEAGIWNVDDRTVVRYANISGGDHIDHWQVEVDGAVQADLYDLGGWLLLAEPRRVVLKRVVDEPSLFEVLPPRNSDEWLAMGQRLATEDPDFDATDLRGILDRIPGRTWTVDEAAIANVRRTDDGFRFQITLGSSDAASDGAPPAIRSLETGQHVIEFDGEFTATPVSAPRVRLSIGTFPARALVQTAVRVEAVNLGSTDVRRATIELTATAANGTATVEDRVALELLSGETAEPVLGWAPASAGRWILTLRVKVPDGRVLAEESRSITVDPGVSAEPAAVLETSAGSGSVVGALVVVIAFTVLAGSLAWRATKGTGR